MIEPKLRFKKDDGSDFPDWEEKKLGDVCDTLTYGMNAAAVKFDGENKYIRITDIDDESHCYKNDELVSPDGELDNKYLVCENDILLARTGASVGKSYLYNKEDGKLYYAGFLIKAHVKSENSKFIFFQTLTERYDKWVKITSMRSGQPGINANEYSDFTMNVPSLPEQQKIADFLSTIDTIIEKQRAMVSAWEERKKGVMQKLFSQEVRFKADDGSAFPDWEEKRLGDMVEFINGRAYKQNELLVSGKYIVLRVGNLFTNDSYYYSDLELDEDKYIEDGNLIYAWSATFGPKIYHGDKCIYHYHIWKLKFDENAISKMFLNYYLQHDVEKIKSKRTGGTMVHITKNAMEHRELEFPSHPEQQKIADCLSALDAVIEKQKETLEKWQELKKGLLQQMFV